MTVEQLIIEMLANFPNLAGFVILAYVLNRVVDRQQETIDRLTDMLNEHRTAFQRITRAVETDD